MEVGCSGDSLMGALPAERKCNLFQCSGSWEVGVLIREIFVLLLVLMGIGLVLKKGLGLTATERDFLVCGAFYKQGISIKILSSMKLVQEEISGRFPGWIFRIDISRVGF